jgi:uncharacterized repeat protein (TIGR01451 family)
MSVTVSVTLPRDELDLNAVTLEVTDADGLLVDRREIDFHARTARTPYPVPDPDPLDTPCFDGMCVVPDPFGTASDAYRASFVFGEMDSSLPMRLTACARDVRGNAACSSRTMGLVVTKRVDPSPVQAGEPLSFYLTVANTGDLPLTATITDVLPPHVTYQGDLTWSATLPGLGGTWTQEIAVVPDLDYRGKLVNRVLVTTREGAVGAAKATVCVDRCLNYLPIVFDSYQPSVVPE